MWESLARLVEETQALRMDAGEAEEEPWSPQGPLTLLPVELFSFFFFKKLIFIGVELLYKVMLVFCCKAKLIDSTNTYIPSFLDFLPI